jgi:hypothetical protein
MGSTAPMIKIVNHIQHVRSPLYDDFESDEKRYEWQMAIRANYLLLGDTKVNVPVDIRGLPKPLLETNIKWLNREELIAGSFMSFAVQGTTLTEVNDVDIYFKSKDDALQFLQQNSNMVKSSENEVLIDAYLWTGKRLNFNLIFGVHYDDPADLIVHFDIRACSIAYDPSENVTYEVPGALADCCIPRVVYNPVPHNTTIARLIKYVQRGFDIDPYQRLFLAELIKSDQYNGDLELTTGYRAVPK